MMKISQVFYLQEKSITLRLFPIRYESASAETIKEPFALQSYKIVVNNEQKSKKNNLIARGLKNTQENFADFCREVAQLLCRSLSITHEKF